jgi:glycolate oxidase FAD binding subunit
MEDFDTLARIVQQSMPGASVATDKRLLHSLAVDGVDPGLVVTPDTIENMVSIIQQARQYPLTVLPSGGGTQLNAGGLPEKIDILLKTTALNHVLEHEAADLTCFVEAGITLEALQQQLATRGQLLAIDPPNPDCSTIGGILATNSSGPKRFRYGTARDLVIGLQVLLANGEIARSGGRVVKNVAGYDLNKLYIGSYGTLGIIVTANFKLHPIPETERTLLLSYPNIHDLIQTVIALTNSPLTPSAIELLTSEVSTAINQDDAPQQSTHYTLAVDFEGSTIAMTRQIDETLKIANQHHALSKDDITGQEQDNFWQTIRKRMHGNLTCKVGILVSQQAAYIQHIEKICHEQHLDATIIAHAGNGILYITINIARDLDRSDLAREQTSDEEVVRILETITALRQRAYEMKGFLIIERCPTMLKRYLSIWGETGAGFYLMQRLKQQFDPQGLFVRGRFVGGLS